MIAFEPNHRNDATTERHVTLGGIQNRVELILGAAGARRNHSTFEVTSPI